MVRGSDSESGDKESKKGSKYDGTVGRWPIGKIKLKSVLFNKGLWSVVEQGPAPIQQTSPASVTPETAAREWYYSGRAGTVQGPCSAEELTGVFENISLNEVLTADSVYVFHHANTGNDWEPWSDGIAHKVRLQGALESRRSRSTVGGDSAVRVLTTSMGAARHPRRCPHGTVRSGSSARARGRMIARRST